MQYCTLPLVSVDAVSRILDRLIVLRIDVLESESCLGYPWALRSHRTHQEPPEI